MNQFIIPALLILSVAAGCQNAQNSKGEATGDAAGNPDRAQTSVPTVGNPQLLYTLPDKYNTPDGMVLAPDGTIYLSVPNLADNTYPGVLVKFAQDSVQFVTGLPAHPETKHAAPMDLAFGPDGNLYYAENQYENDKNYKSRLMRIRMQNGRVLGVDPVVTGFGLANAVAWKGSTIYVTDSQWDMPDNPNGSAVLRFTMDELNKGVVALKPKTADPHVLASFTTQVNDTGVDNGIDGLDYDSKGAFYTGSFGDGTMYKLTLKPDGSLATKEILKLSDKISCVDGLIVDRSTDKLYLCNSRENAIQVITLADGNVSTLVQNGDTDGKDGRIDQPAEVLLKGNRLFITNFDKPEKKFVNTKADEVHTMSYIDLEQ